MEVIIIVLGTLIIPTVVIVLLLVIGRKYSTETQRKEKLFNSMENIIEMKDKMIKQLKSFRLLQ